MARAADTDKDDMEKLQGKWVFYAVRADGKETVEKGAMGFTFSKDKLTLSDGKGDKMGTFKVDTSKKPKVLILTHTEGGKKETKELAYQLKEDTLEVVFFSKPKDADPFSGKDSLVMIFKRQKK
jgi:uncharacterized protein (TIGR03067 family)